jgi:hypothetical protein
MEDKAIVVPDEADTDQQTNLFRTDDPVKVVEKAGEVAKALNSVIEKQNLYHTIQGKKHVTVEGWQTLGSMLGITAVKVHTEELPDNNGYRATVEARRISDGMVLGSADALCTRTENTWKNRDDYALLSMAQTRATSKALRGPLGFIVKLAGFNATPAEEIPADEKKDPEVLNVNLDLTGDQPTQAQLDYIKKLGGTPKEGMTKAEASKMIEGLK